MKILIIDDELVSREKMVKLIENLGYEPLVADNGDDGWNIWDRERPRIILTDWLMPGLPGPELCKKIRHAEGSLYTYIIMVTAKRNTADIVQGMDAGADDFIVKPFVKEELAVRIRAGKRILKSETKDLVIFSLAKLAESRDMETGNHLERIRFYSKTIAMAMMDLPVPPSCLNRLFIEDIFLTSPLHDIGKIGIPDHILLKPGRLDEVEFEIMKDHCQIGFNTLNNAAQKYPKADYLQMSAEIALSHHEKYDGSGYPNKLAGESIPLAARVVALADVYDALVSKRIYKKAFSHEIAKSVIIKEKEKHFDPKIVNAFLLREEKIINIYNQFKG